MTAFPSLEKLKDEHGQEQVPSFISDHYKVTMHSDGTVCVLSCKYCLRQFKPIDRSGRRNWFGAMSHTTRHVNDVLRKRGGGA